MPLLTDFPPDDLRDALVDLYFRNLNDDFPLLHEPMFKEAIASGLHLRDSGFGATVLLVCANGARSSSDPRVLEEPSDDRESSGWKWFKEVQTKRKLLLAPAHLYDLQIYVVRSSPEHIYESLLISRLTQLMSVFLQSTNTPQASWPLIGMGIRAAVDVGAHRKHMYSSIPTSEEELWRRAFWCVNQACLRLYGLIR